MDRHGADPQTRAETMFAVAVAVGAAVRLVVAVTGYLYRGVAWGTVVDSAVATGAMMTVAAALRWGPRAVAGWTIALAMAVCAITGLLVSGSLLGFVDASAEEQVCGTCVLVTVGRSTVAWWCGCEGAGVCSRFTFALGAWRCVFVRVRSERARCSCGP